MRKKLNINQGFPDYFSSATLLPYASFLGPEKCQNIYWLREKTYGAFGDEKIPLYTLIFNFYCSFKTQISSKIIGKKFNPIYPKIHFLIESLRKHYPQKLLELTKRHLRRFASENIDILTPHPEPKPCNPNPRKNRKVKTLI